MKKIISLLLIAAVAVSCLLMAGCSPKGKTLADIKAAGKIVMATSPDFPPFEELVNGEVVGIEADLLAVISQKLGVELEIQQMNFESVLPGTQTGKFDVGAAGISITDERKENVLFTDAYCLAAQAIVVVEGSAIKSKADLEGKKIAVQTATTAWEFCTENGYNVNAYANNSDAQLALQTGKVEAWVIDDLTAAEMVAANNADESAVKLVVLSEAMTSEPYAFAFALGSDDLVAEINTIIAGLVEDGTIKSIFDKYNAPYTSPKA